MPFPVIARPIIAGFAALAMMAAIAAHSPARADSGGLSARLRPSVVMPGQRAMLEIEAPDGLLESMPEPPSPPGMTIQAQGASRIRRGNETRVVSYHVVEPSATGTLTLPSFEVPLADGRLATIPDLNLTVVTEDSLGAPPPANRRLHAILLVPRTTVFTGERFPVQALVLVDPDVNLQNLEQPKLPRAGFAIDRFENPVRGEVAYAGRRWASFAFAASATAMGSGEMTLGPLEAKGIIGIPEPTGNGLFQRFRDFPLTATGDAVTMTVKPFPPDAPQGFEGAVGKFTLEAAFDPPPINPDDPIAVKVTVRGTGDPAQISIPRMEEESGWEFFEGSREESPRDSSDSTVEVTFRRILRPKSTPGPTLPPFQMVFLNPASGSYETARSNALALPVASSPATLPPALTPSAPATTLPPPALPAAAVSVKPGELLLAIPPEFRPRWQNPRVSAWQLGWTLHALGIAALLAFAARTAWLRHAATPAGKRAACRRAFRARLLGITRGDDPQARLLEALRWFEDWRDSPIARPLTPAETTLVNALQDALNDSRYAPPGTHGTASGNAPSPDSLRTLL